nr:DUF4298 domain-containing protein [Actinomyces sp.]
MRTGPTDARTHARLSHFQALYARVERDNAELAALLESLPLMNERLAELVDYYETQWIEDYATIDSFPSGEGSYSILSEDTIYNELCSRRTCLEELRKACSDLLSQG